ncbi:MAG: HAMP domain-containing histidine kinase [Thermoproteota archaeon]|nr:HAMP domain-containing histidine kinase [Thermoproteota archaeon]
MPNSPNNNKEMSADTISKSPSTKKGYMKKTTHIIKGRRRALQEAFRMSLTSVHDYYCITSEELVKSYRPFIPLLIERVNQRNGSSKILVNIERDTLSAAEELTKAGAEIRHMDASSLRRCVVYDNDAAYFSIVEPVITHEAKESVSETDGQDLWIASTMPSVIHSAKRRFLSDWEHALPLDKRIDFLERGIEPKETKVLEKPEEILRQLVKFSNSSREICACSSIEGLKLLYKNFPDFQKRIQLKHKMGKHSGVRWITSINTQSDAEVVKTFLNESIRMRHIKDVPFANFAIGDRMLLSSIDRLRSEDMVTSILTSNDPLYLGHYKNIFEKIWSTAMDAEERIHDIEMGNHVNIQVLPNPEESLKLISRMFLSLQKEVLIIVASNSGLLRTESSGGFAVLNDLASTGIDVKILTSMDGENQDTFDRIRSTYKKIRFRILRPPMEFFNRIIILDREKTIVWEIKDDLKQEFVDALGMAIFIESRSTANSYAFIFESLWKQTELYEQLQSHSRMHKEFIDAVAHELRTPLTPIIGLTEHVKSKVKDKEMTMLLDIVIDSGKKLHTLSENILDITRMEGNLFNLKKERFDIALLIGKIVNDFKCSFRKNKEIAFECNNFKRLFVYADKQRIGQVVSNLLDNAVKFILKEEGGQISINIEKSRNSGKDMVVVHVKDNGEGIHEDILPRLFTKFATRSFYGTGLGLYICKNIIQMHEGEIWGQNNIDGNGAKFSFSLPLDQKLQANIFGGPSSAFNLKEACFLNKCRLHNLY